jgi:ubiquinone/menaquinone biosynthesis C-methylase UbiE
VGRYYDKIAGEEWGRLAVHRTEFAVTMRVLGHYLPPPPARVLDVGGGPGRYALELAGRGYGVTLADVSSGCLDFARGKAAEAGVELAGYVRADAADLSDFPDAAFDGVLMMGPLYHLLVHEDRVRAVREAARVLRPGGLVFASFITRFGVLRYAAVLNPEWILTYADDLLATGLPADSWDEESFPGWFVHPDEVVPLMARGGFETLDLVGCEGVVSRLEERVNGLDGQLWQAWVDLNYRVGHERTLLGAADHLLYAGRQPQGARAPGDLPCPNS